MPDEISVPLHVYEALLAQMTKAFWFIYTTDLAESYKRDLPEVKYSILATQTIEAINMGEEYLPAPEEEEDVSPTEPQ